MHLSIDVPAFTQANVGLYGVENNLNIVKTNVQFSNTDTMSRCGVLTIYPGVLLDMRSSYWYSNLTWSSFRLDSYFDPLVVTSVARNFSLTSSPTKVTFNVVLYNIGFAWNSLTSSFEAPRSGQYFFSLSAAMKQNNVNFFTIKVNGVMAQGFETGAAKLMPAETNDLLSVSSFLQLEANDVVNVWFDNGLANYADAHNYQLSLSGLLYSPPITKQVCIK